MRTIWKYPLEMTDVQTILMPTGPILSVQIQYGIPSMWVLVESDARKIERRFAVYGTGNSIPGTSGQYIGTFQMHGGMMVFHLFELL